MKNTTYLILVLGVILAVTILTSVDQSNASPAPEPKRRKSSSGSSRKSGTSWFGSSSSNSGSSGSSWFGGKNKNKNQGYGNQGYGNTYKKKSKTKSNLKKAAVIGATAYGAYQLGKLSNRFGGYGGGYGYGGHRYGYNDWNRWREIDGFMCRNDNDCNWIDQRLYCQDYELKFTPSALWFGGDAASIVGECACPRGMVWDNYELRCEQNFFSGTMLIVSIVIPILILLCCCCGCFFLARKMFS